MTETVRVAAPRKGRPLEAVLDAVASLEPSFSGVADDVISTLRYEKAITKGTQQPDSDRDAYARLADYSDLDDPRHPDYTLLRDDRSSKPRRIVFDSVTVEVDGVDVQFVGREEPFRSLRTHEFPLGFDSADLVLEEVVALRPEPLSRIADLNDRIDPHDTDVRVVAGLGDTVYHTLLATPDVREAGPGSDLDRAFVRDYEGELCISPRYERLIEAVLGTDAVDGIEFAYPDVEPEEAAVADTGVGVYLTVTGGTARDHGLVVGEHLFPSQTVLLENRVEGEGDGPVETVREAITAAVGTAITA